MKKTINKNIRKTYEALGVGFDLYFKKCDSDSPNGKGRHKLHYYSYMRDEIMGYISQIDEYSDIDFLKGCKQSLFYICYKMRKLFKRVIDDEGNKCLKCIDVIFLKSPILYFEEFSDSIRSTPKDVMDKSLRFGAPYFEVCHNTQVSMGLSVEDTINFIKKMIKLGYFKTYTKDGLLHVIKSKDKK